jgi:Asp/Glu/hydantoin racemase
MQEPPQPCTGVVQLVVFLCEAEAQHMIVVTIAEKEEPAIAATLAEINRQQDRSAKA